MKHNALTLIILSSFFLSGDILADDFRKADNFFEKDDSKNITGFYEDKTPKKEITSPSRSITSSVTEKNRPNILDKKNSVNNFEPSPYHKAISNASGSKVLRLGVIVNSIDKPHLERHLNTLINVSTKLDLDVGNVSFVGGDCDITRKYELPITARFGNPMYLSAPPSEYNITVSPTWVLQTEDGQILLEGIDDPRSYMNSKAEFIDGGGTNSPYQNTDEDKSSGFWGEKNNGGISFF